MKHSKSTKAIALLMSMTMITSVFVGNTLSRYVTSVSSTDSARVAVWGINGEETQMNLFSSEYLVGDKKVIASNNNGDDTFDKVMAPGAKGEAEFNIINFEQNIAPEVAYEVKISLDDSAIDEKILKNPSVQWKLDNGAFGTWDELKTSILSLSGNAVGRHVYGPGEFATAFQGTQEHKIAWQWVLDNDETITVDGNDMSSNEYDTYMGNLALTNDLTAVITVSITAQQVDDLITNEYILDGADQTVNLDDIEPITVRSSADFSTFDRVEVEGTELTRDVDYTAESGSTVITLKEEYLSKLAVGTYTIDIISSDVTATTKFKVVNNSDVIEIIPSFTEGFQLNFSTGLPEEKENYMITDFIPTEEGYSYLVSERQTVDGFTSGTITRCALYNADKEFIKYVYSDNRKTIGTFNHSFSITPETKYFRIQFRITDEDIKIMKKYTNILLEYESNSYIQGIAVSDDYLFASYSVSKGVDGNDYQIQKINRETGEIIQTSIETFNHANGMTYNKNTNELVVVGLNNNSTSESTTDDDFSLFIVDVDNLSLKNKVNLKDIILSVDNDSIGIGQVAYNFDLNEYYIGSRYGSEDNSKYIITLNSDFTLKSSVYLGTKDDFIGIFGDFCADEQYFYIPIYRDDISYLTNEVRIYNKAGILVETKSINGVSHIEGIDKINNKYYMSFINFVGDFPAQIYSMKNDIFNIEI